jgi:RNA polymerase sigma-70 factor (ECF subfamily)
VANDEAPDLVALAAAGDRVALERLLLAHYTPLVRLLAPRLPTSLQSVVSIEDILQDTFSQAFRDVRKLGHCSERSFGAWLKTVAENRLQDAIKSLKRRKRGGDRRQIHFADDRQGSSVVGLLDFVSDGGDSPSRAIVRREARKAVQVAVASLPDDYREAMRLRYLEGKSLDEAAGAMNRSPAAVHGLIDRAKKALRASLGRLSLYLSSR